MKLRFKVQQYQTDTVDSVGDGALIACFAESMGPKIVRVIAAQIASSSAA